MASADEVAAIGLIAGIVLQTGNLIGSVEHADSTHNADFLADDQDFVLQVGMCAVTVVDIHTVVHIGLFIISLNVHTLLAAVANDNTGECHSNAFVVGDVSAQFLQGNFHGSAIVEVRILLIGIDMQLVGFCLCDGSSTSGAVTVCRRVGGQSQTILQDFDVQIAVLGRLRSLVPDPNQVTRTGGVGIPGSVIRLDDDGGCGGQLLLGEVGSGLAVGLDLTGGLGGIDGQVTGLQNTIGHDGGRHIEVGGITVDEGMNSGFHLNGIAVHIQSDGSSVVHAGARTLGATALGALLFLLAASGQAGSEDTQSQQQRQNLACLFHKISPSCWGPLPYSS